jgi:hypothetical protein
MLSVPQAEQGSLEGPGGQGVRESGYIAFRQCGIAIGVLIMSMSIFSNRSRLDGDHDEPRGSQAQVTQLAMNER